MTAPIFKIETRDDLAQAIATFSLSEHTRHRIPLMRSLLNGEIAFLEVGRQGYQKKLKTFLAAVQKPAIVLLGDDDDVPTGPAGWPVAERAFRWARRIILHGTGAEVWQYETIVQATGLVERLVLVECTTGTTAAWLAAAKRWGGRTSHIQVLTVLPGQPAHPVPVPVERRH